MTRKKERKIIDLRKLPKINFGGYKDIDLLEFVIENND